MHWCVNYLGKPWKPGASGPNEFDCWGLISTVMRERAGIDVPLAPVARDRDDLRDVLREFQQSPLHIDWLEIKKPERDLDGALMAQGKYPVHVGLYINADGGKVLHAIKEGGVVCMSLATLRHNGFRVVRWYRHASLS